MSERQIKELFDALMKCYYDCPKLDERVAHPDEDIECDCNCSARCSLQNFHELAEKGDLDQDLIDEGAALLVKGMLTLSGDKENIKVVFNEVAI